MATPYLQMTVDEVASTQDLARSELGDLPVVVIARRQSEGRGRSGADWLNAPRGLAVSVAATLPNEVRPISLTAGVAALRTIGGLGLKWPNDLTKEGRKAGGILVERSGDVVAVGMGLNLWWPDPPTGVTALFDSDPGPELHAELGASWAAELMQLLDGVGWPHAEYRSACTTIGREISWDPEGRGIAIDVLEDGSLSVDVDGERRALRSGAVRHVRG